ncbi:MAG: hypothetical protein QXY45_00060 [Candidatus Aenigmatarchaeota archaeon]
MSKSLVENFLAFVKIAPLLTLFFLIWTYTYGVQLNGFLLFVSAIIDFICLL